MFQICYKYVRTMIKYQHKYIAIKYYSSASNFPGRRFPYRCLTLQKISPAILKPSCQVNSHNYCSGHSNEDHDLFESIESDDLESADISEQSSFKSIKTQLYSNVDPSDHLMSELNDCSTIEQILEINQKHLNEFHTHHSVQSLLLIWSMWARNGYDSQTSSNIIDNSTLKALIQRIGTVHLENMTPDEMTCSLMYLIRFGFSTKIDVMQKLLNQTLKSIKSSEVFPASALARFMVMANSTNELYKFFICRDAFLRVLDNLDACNSSDNLGSITVSLNSLHPMISSDILVTYKDKVSKLLDEGILNSTTKNCLLRVINFLNYPHWGHQNTEIIRRILLILSESLDTFSPEDLSHMFKVFQSHLEPAELIPKITKQSMIHLNNNPTAELLSCTVLYTLPEERIKLSNIAHRLLTESIMDKKSLPSMFKILRSLKMGDEEVCNIYWNRVYKEIEQNSSEREVYKLARHCHRYMYFNNNLGGTYRHLNFEQLLSQLLMDELTSGLSSMIPSKFAKLSSFLIGYGLTPKCRDKLPEVIVNKFESMTDQFEIYDCLLVSRGLQIAMYLRYRHYISSEIADQTFRIETVLNKCAKRHLGKADLTVIDLNNIIRSLTIRKANRNSELYEEVMKRYKSISTTNIILNSRVIRDICFNLSSSNYLIPEYCDKMCEYLLKNHTYVTGDTLEKILGCFYSLGYTPNDDTIFDLSADIIHRDFNFMTGMSIVQSCLSLTYWKALPLPLIHRVFNIDFIKRLENEIDICYSKAKYPELVLNQVMQLNRAVCLDYPEAGVPWFQQNFIEAQMSKQLIHKNPFNFNIKEILLSIVPNSNWLWIDYTTPYGYKIDFVLHINKERQLIEPPKESTTSTSVVKPIDRIAIVLLHRNDFTLPALSQVRGEHMLKRRHLEMLGFTVVQISSAEWNSMYMNIPGARSIFLKNLLRISSPS